jgi:amino acid adenylation domain-containing protein
LFELLGLEPGPPAAAADPGDVALVLHTSGTTGRPKIVPLTHANLCASARSIAETLALGERDRCLEIMPLFHIHGLVASLLAPLTAGGSVACPPIFQAPRFFQWMEALRPTWYSAVPTMHQAILSRAAEHRDTIVSHPLRFIRSSSSPLPPSLMDALEASFAAPVIEAYGMTEASHQMASNPFPPRRRKPGSVGLAAGPKIAVMDEAGSLLPRGTIGEIVVRGPGVTKGYETGADANARAFTSGWFRTGDQGYLDADGYLFLTGRLKELINKGGEKIAPRDVEETLLTHPAIAQAVAFAVPEGRLGEEVAAAVVLRDGGSATERELQELAAARLAPFKVPRRVVFVSELPKGPTGKLQRTGLAQRLGVSFETSRAPETAPIAPRSALERSLARLWTDLLRCDVRSVADSFFDLGGDSTLAMICLARVQADLGVDVSFPAFFAEPTLAGLARAVEAPRSPGVEPQRLVADPERAHEPFPLTDIQEAYWVGRGEGFELGGVACHSYFEFAARGIDLARLSAAWRGVVERHGMLRAIVLADGQQQILREVPRYEIPVDDLSALAPDLAQARLAAVRQELSHQILPSERWPLFDIRATRLAGDRLRLHFSFDALIMDALSRALVFRDWGALYARPDAELRPLALSFRDYVLAERRQRDGEAYRRSREYWLDRLDALPPAPDLPLAVAPAAIGTPRFVTWSERLDAPTWRRLKKSATQAGLTSAGLLVGAFSEVLATWSRSPRFSLNLTVFSRSPLHPEVIDVVGDFTSLILLEVDPGREGGFTQRARRLQEQLWHDLDHRHFGAIQVLRELARRRGAAGAARMPVVFTSRLGLDSQAESGTPWAWLGELVNLQSQTPQVFLDHSVWEEAGALVFSWSLVDGLFPDGMARDMFAALRGLLLRLADCDPARGPWVESRAEVSRRLLPPEQLALQESVNATAGPPPAGRLEEPFVARAAETPERIALVTPRRTLTYGELDLRSTLLARELRDHGARANHPVAVVMEKGWEQMVAVLGILKAGAAYLPVDATLPAERIRALLGDGRVELLTTQLALDARLDWPARVTRFVVRDAALPPLPPGPLPPTGGPDDLAYVIYTSGSSGAPKGVAIEHRAAMNTIADVNRRHHVGCSDRVLGVSSLGFDLSVYDIFGVLGVGGALVLPEPTALRDPARWAELVLEHGVTLWNSVPALAELLVDYLELRPERRPATLRLALLSGDWIPLTLPDRLRAACPGVEAVSLGGATEASIWSIAHPIGAVDPRWESIPYGRPLVNQTFHVLDDVLAPRPLWVPGDLYIGGAGLARGYWGDEQQTRERFLTHPTSGARLYKTGDRGRFLPDGSIEFLGREDLQVKIQGHRIELAEVEAALERCPGVRAAAVAATGARFERRLVGYVVPETPPGPSVDEIRRLLAAELPEAMIPAGWVFLERLPLTANGKLDRSALPRPAPVQAAARVAAASSSTAARIVALAARVLKQDGLSAADNLLALGATSVDMIRIANRIESELGRRPALDDLYRAPSIAALAASYGEPGKSPLPGPPSFGAAPTLQDPDEREAFKRRRAGLRDDEGRPTLALLGSEPPATERRSRRQFSFDPVPLEALGRMLAALAAREQDGQLHYGYGSAGGLNPVQTYLFVKAGRVEGLEAGTYYFHPLRRALTQLARGVELDRDLYGPLVNRPIFDEAAFAVFLVADMAAIAPMYGERSLHYATIEAGAMTQLLETAAPGAGLGLCQIGQMSFDAVRGLFALGPSHTLVHSLLGGRYDPAQARNAVLSAAQERIASVARLEPESAYYNACRALRLRGALDVARLASALAEVVRRHEVLRTTCRFVNDKPVLAVSPPVPVGLRTIELRGSLEVEAEARRRVAEESLRPLALDEAPLLRALLLRLEHDDHVLALTTHLFASDGWSMQVLWRDLAACYRRLGGAAEELPHLALQYRDFARGQRARTSSGAFRGQLAHWRSRLEGAPKLVWPGRPPTPAGNRAGDKRPVLVPAEVAAALRELARNEGATPFMVLLAGLAVLIARVTGQGDLVIGTIVSNRNRSGAEDVIGTFANSLALRIDAGGDPSFRELLARARAAAVDAYANQDVPFEQVVAALPGQTGSGARTPLFQVLLLLHERTSAETFALPGVEATSFPVDDGLARFDLALDLAEAASGLTGSLTCASDLLVPEDAARLVEALNALLASGVAAPEQRISELPAVALSLESVARQVPALRATSVEPRPGSPAEDVEQRLVAVFEEVLGIRGIERGESFFERGGHSLAAVRLVQRIEKAFGRRVPIATLFEAPSVELLAQRLFEEPRTSAALVPIQPRGSRLPLFLLHGIGGGALHYLALARGLSADQPVWGLQPPEEERAKTLTLEAIASRYLEHVRTLQPHGPYLLAGHCFGGMLAFEMAQQLQAAGEQPAFVGLIETHGPGGPSFEPLARRVAHHLANLKRLGSVERAKYVRVRLIGLGPFLRRRIIAGPLRRALRRLGLATPQALQHLEGPYVWALRQYSPRPFPGRLTLFRALEQPVGSVHDAQGGWGNLARGGVEVHDVPGSHGTILENDNVALWAGLFEACIERSQAEAREASRHSRLPPATVALSPDSVARPVPVLEAISVEPARAPSAEDVEQRLAALFEEALGIRGIERGESFFERGGHSLAAVRLIEQIEKAFGRRLPIATLFEAPSVELLAQRLFEEPRTSAALVPIQPRGGRPPFFLVHGVYGGVGAFRELALHLGDDQPLYGLAAPGGDADAPPRYGISTLADHYLREIRALHSEAPLLLGGFCMGGAVAFEMACRLEAEGERVELLALIDPPPLPLGYRERPRERLRVVATAVLGSMRTALGLGASDAPDEPSVARANRRALRGYRPGAYRGRATLFLATDGPTGAAADAVGALRRLARGGLETHFVRGKHMDLLQGAAVRDLANLLSACFAAVRTRSR